MYKILDIMDSEKEILEQLIEIDNKVMNDKLTYKDILKKTMKALKEKKELKVDKDILFITEGDYELTIGILSKIENMECKVVIFINQNYIALNKWLISKYHELTGNMQHIIDFGDNYNAYIGKDYNVIPVGSDDYKKIVWDDFCE
mgnify:FL=1